jgi:hypothetical protein
MLSVGHLGFRIDSGYIWCYCFGGVKRIAKFTSLLSLLYRIYFDSVSYRIAIDFDQLPVL